MFNRCVDHSAIGGQNNERMSTFLEFLSKSFQTFDNFNTFVRQLRPQTDELGDANGICHYDVDSCNNYNEDNKSIREVKCN